MKTKGIADPIFDYEGVRVAVFDLKELRCREYLKDIYLQILYLIRHRNSGKVAKKFKEDYLLTHSSGAGTINSV